VFQANLKAGVLVWHYFVHSEEGENAIKHRATASQLQHLWAETLTKLVRKRIFRPHLYFLLSFLLLAFTRRRPLVFALLASGIAHELGLLALAPAVDYRYNHWMIVTTIISVILLVVLRLRPERRIESTA
jgi:hypothetical protein